MRVWSRLTFGLLFCVAAAGASAQTLGASSFPTNAVTVGDTAYFEATTSATGKQIYTTNGTPAGTSRLTWLPGAPNILSNVFVHQGKTMFFAQLDSLLLYETDGSSAWPRTALNMYVKRFSWVASTGTSIVFATPSSVTADRYDFWQTDGNSTAVTLITSVTSTRTPFVFTSGGRAYFYLYPNQNTADLWTTDGTAAGTKQLFTAVTDSQPFNNRLLVRRNDGLWITDGTQAGATQLIVSTGVSSIAPTPTIAYIATMAGLYKTDGTPGGTVVLKALSGIIVVKAIDDGRALLIRDTHDNRLEFWSSDGTDAGTVKYTELVTPLTTHYPIVASGNRVFFTMVDSTQDLWKTDGTAAGTGKIKALTNGSSSAFFPGAAVNGNLFLASDDMVHGSEPWFSDGTAAGTKMLANLEPEAVLRGHVTDATSGAALTGSKVSIFSAISGSLLGTFPVNADGTFAIEGARPGSYKLGTTSSDEHIDKLWSGTECIPYCEPYTQGQVVTVSDALAHDGYDFALRQGVLITGTATGSTGAPVSTTISIGPAYGTATGTTYSSSFDSTYRLGPFPAGSYVLWSGNSSYSTVIYPNVSCAAGCDAGSAAPQAYAAGTHVRNFVMKPQGTIRGQILSSLASLTPRASVQLWRAGSSSYERGGAVSGSTWEDRLPDGQWQILVDPNDGEHVDSWYSTSNCRPCTRAQATIVSAVPGAVTTGYDVTLPHVGSTISGTMTDRVTHAAVPGITVHVQPDGYWVQATTDANGFYSMKVPAGTYYVYTDALAPYPSQLYDAAGGRLCQSCDVTTGAPVVVGEEQTASNISMTLAGNGTISGRVTEAAGGAAVAFKTVVVYTANGGVKNSGSTDTNGNYTILVPSSESYYVAVPTSSPYLGEVYNNIPCSPCSVTIGTPVTIPASGARTGIDFTLDKSGALTGTILDNATSHGLANVDLTLTATGLPTRFGGTTGSGTFTMSNLQAGTYTLTVAATGYTTATQTVTITNNQTTNVTVRLNASGATGGAAPGDMLTGVIFTKTKP